MVLTVASIWASLVMHHDRDRTILVSYTLTIPVAIYIRHSVSDSFISGESLPGLEQFVSWILLCKWLNVCVWFYVTHLKFVLFRFAVDFTFGWSHKCLAQADRNRDNHDPVVHAVEHVLRSGVLHHPPHCPCHVDQTGGIRANRQLHLDAAAQILHVPAAHPALLLRVGQPGEHQQLWPKLREMLRDNLLTFHHGCPAHVEDHRSFHSSFNSPLGNHCTPTDRLDEGLIFHDTFTVEHDGRPVFPLGHFSRQLARHWHLTFSLRHRSVDRFDCDGTAFGCSSLHLRPPLLQSTVYQVRERLKLIYNDSSINFDIKP